MGSGRVLRLYPPKVLGFPDSEFGPQAWHVPRRARGSMQAHQIMTQHETHTAQTPLAESLAAYVRDDEAMQHVHRLAERQGAPPARLACLRGELVTDVIEDMFMGEAKCNPERKIAPQVEREVLRPSQPLAGRPTARAASDAMRPRPEFISAG